MGEMPNEKEEWVRLLVCLTCHSIDEVAPHYGTPGSDIHLEKLTSRHRFLNDELHEVAPVFVVKAPLWRRERKSIEKQIWDRTHTGLDPEHYNDVENLKNDAYKCWNERLRPFRCGDFHSEKKLLVPKTQEERRDAGLGKYNVKNPGQARYLCDFCVCRMRVETEINEKRNV